jgi:exo-beta-1,3-glucanase (GH17 family)
MYFEDLMNWSEKNKVLVFFFQAFDESWKGSSDPNEPEKHRGLYRTDSTPKIAISYLITEFQ